MEMKRLLLSAFVVLLLGRGHLHGQGETQNYTIRDGRMYISLSKNIGLAELNSFMSRYNRNAIGLYFSLSGAISWTR